MHTTAAAVCTCLRNAISASVKGKGRADIRLRALHTTSRTTQQASTTTIEASDRDLLISQNAHTTAVGSSETAAEDRTSSSSNQAEFQDDVTVLERRRRMLLMSELESVGSTQTRSTAWQPHHSMSRPPKPSELTLSHLLASTAHLGHSSSHSSPFSFAYTYGTRHGINIIDVRETLTALRRAANLVRSTVENDGIVLFLGGASVKGSDKVLQRNAAKLGSSGYSATKWLPGTLTNASRTLSGSVNMIRLSQSDEEGAKPMRPSPTSYMPSLIILFAPLNSPNALREANALNIPTIALCDTNVDPRHFTYPIPCNDDSLRVVELISGVLAEAGKEGLKRKEATIKQAEEYNRRFGLQLEYEDQQQQDDQSKQPRWRKRA